MKSEALTRWTCDQASELYGIRNWGSGYFDVSASGDVIVRPGGAKSSLSVSLMDLLAEAHERKLSPPILLRFSDLLQSRIREINNSFAKAIQNCGYNGEYRAVYPTKVNQQREVVEDIVRFGREFHHGLEAGSKAELIAAIAHTEDPDALVICNGYKDEEFIDLALYARQMGLKIILVAEMPGELKLILKRAKSLGIQPLLGIRAKLSSRPGGHWDASGGDRSKFGLSAPQMIRAVDYLRENDMLDCLRLLHYHLGSQVSDIRKVRTALNEACNFYADLCGEGARMGILDIGGGLAVDYDGSHTNFHSSRNYTTQEYAADVVETIMDSLDRKEITHPTIVSESGRATVAHHSVLIFNVLDVLRCEPLNAPDSLPDDANEMMKNLVEVRSRLTSRNAQEAYHDAVHYRDEVRSLFLHGDVTLRERAAAESLFWQIIRRIADIVRDKRYIPDEMAGLDAAIADVYYGNFSVFQSLPDSWAIDHLFPIIPIHRLNERPTRQATLADISCDSDGKLDKFIDLRDVKHTLPLHELDDKEYYLGAFLVGAYQETLGDMHNLLGDINVLHVRIDESGAVQCVNEIAGDSVQDVLSYVEYDTAGIFERIRSMTEQAVGLGQITEDQKSRIVEAYEAGMQGYTYFEK